MDDYKTLRPTQKVNETESGEPMANELDYAVLRLDKPGGRPQQTRPEAGPDAAKRGWIKISLPPPTARLNLDRMFADRELMV